MHVAQLRTGGAGLAIQQVEHGPQRAGCATIRIAQECVPNGFKGNPMLERDGGNDRAVPGANIDRSATLRAVEEHLGQPPIREPADAGRRPPPCATHDAGQKAVASAGLAWPAWLAP
jgi:hypothetical protein